MTTTVPNGPAGSEPDWLDPDPDTLQQIVDGLTEQQHAEAFGEPGPYYDRDRDERDHEPDDTDIRNAFAADLTRMDLMPEPAAPAQHYRQCGEPLTLCGIGAADAHETADPHQVTCAGCSAALVDEQLAAPDPLPDKYAAMIPNPHPMENCGPLQLKLPPGVACPTCGTVPPVTPAEPVQPEPVQHTFALVVIDEQIRRTSTLPELFPDARIATVHSVGDRRTVMDTDAEWRAQIGDRPALILARMLGAAAAWADTVIDAELLMPGPDVLAALTGRLDARWWSEPIRIDYRDVRPGWLLIGTAEDDGTETRELVTAVSKCTDDGCIHGRDYCIVLDTPLPVHFPGWRRADFRVPADFVVDELPVAVTR